MAGAPAPRVIDGPTAEAWLKELPLANPPVAHSRLVTLLAMLGRTNLEPAGRMAALEVLRDTVAFLAEEQGKRCRVKAVPFEPQVQAAWDDIMALWQRYFEGLMICVSSNAAPLLSRLRALQTVAAMMLEHYYAYRRIPNDLWLYAYTLYREIESQGTHREQVADELARRGRISAEEVFLQLLLLHLVNPYGFNPRQIATVRVWLETWGGKTELQSGWASDTQPVTVDLGSNQEPRAGKIDGKDARYIDVYNLAKEWGKRLKWVKRGGDPVRAGLGKECRPPSCEELLAQVYRLLYQGRKGRQFPRRQGAPEAKVAFGFSEIYHHIAGEPFDKNKKSEEDLSRTDLRRLELFGSLPSEEAKKQKVVAMPPLESWRIRDESALGFGLARPPGQGRSIVFRQLLAIRPLDSDVFALGVIRWLVFDVDNELQVGISLLPGSARPVSVSTHVGVCPGFVLPALPSLKETSTLVLTTAHYRYGQRVEVLYQGQRTPMILGALREAGADFCRAEFELVE